MEFPNIWRIWDAEKIEVLREFTPDGRPLFTADREKYLMVTESTGALGLWEVKTGKCIQQTVQIDKHLYPALLSPDARWAVFRGNGYESAYFDLRNKKRIDYVKDFFTKNDAEKKQEFLYPIIFSSDSKTVLASKMKGATASGAALCDAATLKVIKEIPDVGRVKQAAFTSDGQRLLILDHLTINGYPLRLRCWDVKSSKELWGQRYTHADEPPELKFVVPSPKGDVVLLVSERFQGGGRNTRPTARMVMLATKTGEIVSRVDADVFPDGIEDFPDPNSEK